MTILRGLVGLVDADPAGDLGDRGDTLGDAGLEELLDTRQTVGDVGTGHTTGVEGTHRQLGAGLTDRLGGDDADRLADVDQLAGGQRTAVAGRADTDLGLAHQRERVRTVSTPASTSARRSVTSLMSVPTAAMSLPSTSTSSARMRPWTLDSAFSALTSVAGRVALSDRAAGPRGRCRSRSSRMMTSWATSTRRRVR